MKTRFNVLIIASCVTLSASADKAHDAFSANKDAILAQPVTVCGDVAFSVGKATSPRGRGDAVGYSKAEECAKWNLGDKFRATAAWPADIQDSEKDLAWLEYRSQHPERLSVFGMQRILTQKTPPDNYMVVLSFPADQIEVSEPTATELKSALDKVRERRRIAAELAKKAVEDAVRKTNGVDSIQSPDKEVNGKSPNESKTSDRTIKKYDNLDEDLML